MVARQKWRWRLWSNTPDESDQRILCGQDKHLPFITVVAYYTGLYNLLCEGCPLIQPPGSLGVKMQSHHLIARKGRLWGLQFFNIFFPKLNITAQSRDKQTTAGNLLVLLNALFRPVCIWNTFLFGISICVHTQRDSFLLRSLQDWEPSWPARHYWQQNEANSQGEKSLQIKSKHQWTVVTLANAIIQTPVFPFLSIGSGTEH